MDKSSRVFDVRTFLGTSGLAKTIVAYRRSEIIFAQGDPSDRVMYIQEGGVKLSAQSKGGRDVVVAMLGPGDFFGEGCLAGQSRRLGNATAVTHTSVLTIQKMDMNEALRDRRAFSDDFIAHLLAQHVHIEQQLIDQILSA